MATSSPLAAHHLGSSLDLADGADTDPQQAFAAGRDFVRVARDHLGVDGEWLPDLEALCIQPEAAAAAARITAAAVLDHDDRASATTSLLMRLYRNYATAAENCSEHPTTQAARHRAGEEPGNPLVPDVQYLTVGAPPSMPREAVRETSRLMMRAHGIGLIETEHMRAHATGAVARVDACEDALSVLLAIVGDATDAASQRICPASSELLRGSTPCRAPVHPLTAWLNSALRYSERAPNDIVVAIARNLATGETPVPDTTAVDAGFAGRGSTDSD